MAGLAGIDALWRKLAQANPCGVKVFRVGVTLFDLTPASIEWLFDDDAGRQRRERASAAIDGRIALSGRTVISLSERKPPAGGHVGGKIPYTRIPS